MKSRLTLFLGILLATTPASVGAQTGSPQPEDVEHALVSQLCAATSADAAELDACIASVETALAKMLIEVPAEEQSLLDQVASSVDDTLESLRQVDIEAALDDVLASAQDFELDVDLEGLQETLDQAVADAQTAIDQLELPTDVDIDIQGALEDAVAQALTAGEDLDLQGAIDSALADAQAAIDDADVQGAVDEAVVALQDGVADAQAIVAEAQAWAQENRDAVCRGGSISLGTTVGVAVFVVTGVEWLGLQSFWATERLTNGICGDVVGDE
jgi:hypothetical protein